MPIHHWELYKQATKFIVDIWILLSTFWKANMDENSESLLMYLQPTLSVAKGMKWWKDRVPGIVVPSWKRLDSCFRVACNGSYYLQCTCNKLRIKNLILWQHAYVWNILKISWFSCEFWHYKLYLSHNKQQKCSLLYNDDTLHITCFAPIIDFNMLFSAVAFK